MSKTLWSVAAALALMSGTASAQTVQSVLQAASKAMGADNLKCITYTGTSGYVGIVGQAHDIRDDWPQRRDLQLQPDDQLRRQILTRGPHHPSRAIIRASAAAAFRSLRRSAAAEFRRRQVRLEHAGRQRRTRSREQADLRQIDIWMSPHGFIKGAHGAGRQSGADHAL